jgi:hypothetical protein
MRLRSRERWADGRGKKAAKKWIQNNKEKYNYINNKCKIKRIQKIRYLVEIIKSGPCVDCHKTFPAVCMDFDHLPQFEKTLNISDLVHQTPPMAKLKAEISKCELVCGNCHRLRTVKRCSKTTIPCKALVRRRLSQQFANQYKNKPCEICNCVLDPCQMDFDHIDPSTKKYSICELVRKRASREAILLEIQKCRVLCVNCHRIVSKETRIAMQAPSQQDPTTAKEPSQAAN